MFPYLLKSSGSSMVSFRLPGSKAARLHVTPKEKDDDASSSSSQSVAESPLAGPSTPDGIGGGAAEPGAAAALHKKYWPSTEEVQAVLDLLSKEDREQCDEDMANRSGGARRSPRCHCRAQASSPCRTARRLPRLAATALAYDGT